MKIAIFGIIPFTDLIKEGFVKLGHEISNNNDINALLFKLEEFISK